MSNPMFGNKVSPNGATAPNDSLNDSYKRYKRGYNSFSLSRSLYTTERYADINLIEAIEGVEGDRLRFGNKHDIRSHTLKSPIMFDVYKKKTYFMVDNQAILPINWKKVYKHPNKGDDVLPLVNCLANPQEHVHKFLYDIRRVVFSPSKERYNYLWRVLLLLESIFSNGSLLSNVNCHLSSSLVDETTKDSFDKWLDETYRHFDASSETSPALYVRFPQLSDKLFTNYQGAPQGTYNVVSHAQILDMMRTFPDFDMHWETWEQLLPNYESWYLYIVERLKSINFVYTQSNSIGFGNSLNLSRLIAYQLVCSQFYTRDSVDNIYNAESFIDNAKSTVMPFIAKSLTLNSQASRVWPSFSYNGTNYDYDVFSANIIDTVLRAFFYDFPFYQDGNFLTYDDMRSAYNYLHMIFFFRKSLRYGDYFVGAKTLPYAPADVTADVVSNSVSAIDVTRSILMQRFANAVERVSNTWKDYISGVMDGVVPPSPFEPRFLASSTSRVGGFEVENTAENQGNIVTILRSGNSNYVYELEVGEPCIVIGVSTYEVPRVYSRTVDRFFRHYDRFDMFNKFMQNVGDQEISLNERSATFSPEHIFGYTPRHMEYKQRYPIAAGGFVEDLPGYSFITDNVQSGQNDIDFSNTGLNISSYYIRNRNSEFDRFYSSLTGLTLANYFHFIVKYDCICDAARQMEYSPSIL